MAARPAARSGVLGPLWLSPGSAATAATTATNVGLKTGPLSIHCSVGASSMWSPEAALPPGAQGGRVSRLIQLLSRVQFHVVLELRSCPGQVTLQLPFLGPRPRPPSPPPSSLHLSSLFFHPSASIWSKVSPSQGAGFALTRDKKWALRPQYWYAVLL